MTGLQIGAKAETAAYIPGFFSAQMSAPWPPIEWPLMARLPGITGKFASISAGNSWVT